MSDSFIGRTFGNYQVESKLGQGGMGKVYCGRQISLNRRVAIKVLTAQMAMDPEFVERFQQEARVIAALKHENIVHIYDIDETRNADGDAIYFIVMELVEGYTLSQRPDAGRPMVPKHVRTIGVALAHALDFAHRQGIVHRDIKGANVMVTLEGQIKLMDFGIAKSAGGVKTATGSVLGTPEYMAPEQARSGLVTAQTDIYSLGVLLYELATGRLPFTGLDPFAIALKHISEMASRPRDVEPTVPEWLERIILRCLAKEPADRFASAAELGAALQHAESRPIDARLPPPPPLVGATVPMPPTPAPQGPQTPPGPPPHDPTQPAPSDSALGPTWVSAEAVAPPPYATRQPYGTQPQSAASPPTAPPGPSPSIASPSLSRGLLKFALLGAGALLLLVTVAAGFWLGRPQPTVAPPERVEEPSTAAGVAITESDAAALSPEDRADALADVRAALAAGDVAQAGRAAAPLLGTRGDPEVAAVIAEVEAAEMQSEALGILDEARSSGLPADLPTNAGSTGAVKDDSSSRNGAGVAIATAPAAPAPAETPQAAPPAAPRRSPDQLRRLAQQQKDGKQYHSLKRTLDEWIATGSASSDAHTWRGKIDRWIKSREEDLRDELEDHLDELADTIEDRDLEDVAKLWDNRLDAQSQRFFSQLFERYRKLDVEVQVLESRPVDDRIDYLVEIRVSGREERRGPLKAIRTSRWRGRLVDDGDVRFLSTFTG